MTEIPIAEAEKHFAELAERVAQGETIVVTKDGAPVLDLVPHQRKGGIDWAAIEAFKRERGIDRIFEWDPETFDDPIPEEEFLTFFEPGK